MASVDDTVWTDHLIARFTKLHASDKYSFRAMAEMLSREFGVKLTKNALIGKGRRLDLKPRPRVLPPRAQRAQQRAKAAPPIAPEAVPVMRLAWRVALPSAPYGRITIQQLSRHTCHFPFGDRPPYFYCGDPTAKGSPYCPMHNRVVYSNYRVAPRRLVPVT